MSVEPAILNRVITPSLGAALTDVRYWVYPTQVSEAEILSGLRSIVGQVELVFYETRRLFLSWDQGSGHFSLAIAETSLYNPDTIVPYGALRAPEWTVVADQPLMSAELVGEEGVPHALILRFTRDGVVIGDGSGDTFGDGDEILIRNLPEPQLAQFTQHLWRVGSAT